MGNHPTYDELGEYPGRYIRHKANQMIAKAGLSHQDVPDLEQELWLDLLIRLKKFDHAKGELGAFVTSIVTHKVANLMRDQSTSSPGVTISLDQIGEIEDRAQIESGSDSENLEERQDRTIDLGRVLEILPDRLRWFAEQLRERNVSELSREADLSRTTIYKAIGEIRKAFLAAGLDEYQDID